MAAAKEIIVELSEDVTDDDVESIIWLINSGVSKGDYGLEPDVLVDVRYQEFD